MSWLDLVENPEAVKGVYATEPSLKNVEVVSVLADRDGPTVTVEMMLREPPSRPSIRWKRAGVNAVNVKLQLLGVETLTWDGWTTDNRGTVDIRRGSQTKIDVDIDGPALHFRCCCRWLRLAGLTGYRHE